MRSGHLTSCYCKQKTGNTPDTLDRLLLIRLEQCSRGSWQPVFLVLNDATKFWYEVMAAATN